MPWRGIRDPYQIWISEVMLQQTQVETIIPRYLHFTARFPNVRSLTEAPLSEVMKAWEGLGYYARARNLHRAAKIIFRDHMGKFPDTLEGWLSLPGIGPYTAGAVLSIAFEKPVPILDGNIIRLLSRYFHVTDPVDQSRTKKYLWSVSNSLLPGSSISDFNQGMMELGSQICTPKNPDCGKCPVRAGCRARKLKIQNLLPVRIPRKQIPHFDVTAGVIWKKGRVLITLRPAKGLLGSLWEFPGGKKERGETLEECLHREIMEELGIRIRISGKLIRIRHAYTHFKITLHVYQCEYATGILHLHACDDFRWIRLSEINRYAFPAADQKVIKLLIGEKRMDSLRKGYEAGGLNP